MMNRPSPDGVITAELEQSCAQEPIHLPATGKLNDAHQQGRIFADFGAAIARLRHAERLDDFFAECAQVVQAHTAFDRPGV